ncbi:MAG: hypothetical protein WCC06_10830 [Candidatus Aminicenantales bacterium]
MKKTAPLTIAVLLLLLLVAAEGLQIKKGPPERPVLLDTPAPVNISRTSSDSDFPIIQLDGNGAAYVIWIEDWGVRNIYFATSKSGQWSNPQKLVEIDSISPEAPFPSFSVSPSGIGHLTFHDARGGSYDIYYMNYDNTWSSLVNISQNPEGSAYSACAVSPTDNYCYAVWMDGEFREWELFWKYRSPSGNWGSRQTLPIGTGYTPSVATDATGAAHVVWITRDGDNSTVWYSRNNTPRDQNQWTSPVAVKGATLFEWCWPKVACDNAGNAYVVWIDKTQGNQEVFFRKRNAATGSWEPEVNVSQTGGISDEPDVAVNKTNGSVYVAWTEQNDGRWDIFLNSYATAWSGASNMSNSDAASKMPSIAVDNSGTIHLAYADVQPGNWEIMYIGTAQLPPPVQKPYPPLDLSLDTQLNDAQTHKINTLAWNRNPQNKNFTITNYKVFRKNAQEGDQAFSSIATVSGDTYRYVDSSLPLNQKYTYACTAVSQGGTESDMSVSVTEERTFSPLNITLSTVSNSSLFQDEKINIIAWQNNPLNDAVTVAYYNIYRKKIGESDSQYQRLVTLDGTTYEYKDRNLPFNEKYSYVLTTVNSTGDESKRSSSVSEN